VVFSARLVPFVVTGTRSSARASETASVLLVLATLNCGLKICGFAGVEISMAGG
jgi:hypothetical protein